ncbi:hypothetical protein ACLOJK_035429 [Asimina triloba]
MRMLKSEEANKAIRKCKWVPCSEGFYRQAPNKEEYMVHEKEFLLKDLMTEGSLGREERRVGEVCSKRVYRILMAQNGNMKTDDAEDGAGFFGS